MKKSRKYPLISVKAILRYKDRVLMIKNSFGRFEFPGGKVKFRESVLDALYRELKEELDYSPIQTPILFDVWDYIPKGKYMHVIFIHCMCVLTVKPEILPSEKLEVNWLSKGDMERINAVRNKEFREKIFTWSNRKRA